MNWFTGKIAEAVAVIKRENKSLFVYIFEESADSTTEIDHLFSLENVNTKFSHNIISLKFSSESETFKQFSNVYTVEKIPSFHVILSNGKRTATKTENFTAESIIKWIGDLTDAKPEIKDQPLSTINTAPINTVSIKQSKPQEFDFESEESKRAKLLRDRIEEQKLEKLQELKRCEELKLQIQEDRKETERRRKFEQESEHFDTSAENIYEVHQRNLFVPKLAESNNSNAKISFRFSHGKGGQVIKEFVSQDTIRDVIRPWLGSISSSSDDSIEENFLIELKKAILQTYEFKQLRPPRSFNENEEALTLGQLGLCPTAVLIIQPKSGQIVKPYVLTNMYYTITGIIHSLSQNIWHYVSSIFYSSNNAASTSQPSTSGDEVKKKKSANISKEAIQKRHIITQGRINRLSHRPEGSDDENARWNGNSTSQL